MPLIGGLLATLFSGLATWLTLYVSRKVAFGLASVATMTALTAGLYVVMRGAMAGLNSQAFGLPEFWSMVLSVSIPPAAPFCFSSYMTCWAACTVYTWQRDLLNILVKV